MRISLCAIVVTVIAAHATAASAHAIPDGLGTPIDLSNFSGTSFLPDESEEAGAADAVPIVEVDDRHDATWIRPYVTGIAGASFGTINAGGNFKIGDTTIRSVGTAQDAMFTGGGAVGMALDRQSGLLRMEIEGRGRGPIHGQSQLVDPTGEGLLLDVVASGGWSAMTNFWRDWFVTDRCGVYGGGGFGIGGYQYLMQGQVETVPGSVVQIGGSSAVNTFAWQVGTGFTYELSDRVTFDTGYRFFAMSPGTTAVSITNGVLYSPYGTSQAFFSASELLLSVRIYEPFRNWR